MSFDVDKVLNRNRRIGEFLKELKLTEGRSTGLPKIKRAMKNNNSPEPIFDTNDDRDYFLTILPIHERFIIADNIEAQDEAQDGVQDGVQDEARLSNFAQKILKVCGHQPLSKQEIMEQINQSNITKSIRNAFAELLNLQFIAYTIPDKPSSKNQRYVLTSSGQRYLRLFAKSG